MRGLLTGMVAGGLVSVIGLGALSVVSETPAGLDPPSAPLVDAPAVVPVSDRDIETDDTRSSPVGSITIQEPQAPKLPEGEAVVEPDVPVIADEATQAPSADTDPISAPDVSGVEGTMSAPSAPDSSNLIAQPVDPILPSPQALAPQTPENETDLVVSTAPAQATIVVEPDAQDGIVDDTVEVVTPQDEDTAEDFFVVDLGAETLDVPTSDPEDNASDNARIQLGGANTLLSDRDTGVTIRRPTTEVVDTVVENAAAVETTPNALTDYAAELGDVAGKPLMSVVLIDDGDMQDAAAALAGLPFSVTIALDPAMPDAGDKMAAYRADGFEVVVMAKLPDGALPSDVEVTFESVFARLPETVGVLDIGAGGLQADRDVTQQAMGILASQGRGFIQTSTGLNMAGRAAEQAGVPAVVVYRDLDSENQDARVVRRFVDQAAFRARQESGVVLVGRVRADTISALILWGTSNLDDQIAVVPVSAVLLAQ